MTRFQTLLLTLALGSGCVPGAWAVECREDSASLRGYTVRSVDIESPISFFAAATFGFDQLKAELALQPNRPFDSEKLSVGNRQIADRIRAIEADTDQKVKFAIVSGRPEDCDSANHSLRVVYHVFTNVYRPYLSHTFEQRTAEVKRPATTGAEGGTQGRYMIKPFGGYDRSLHGFAGVDASARTPLAFVKSLQVHSSFSSNSTDDSLEATGASYPHRKALEHMEWQLGFRYFDLPAGSAKLKQGTLAAQFLGSTQELTKQSVVFRFGGALEGGHQQTGAVSPELNLPPNSSLGSLKLFFGSTARFERQSFAFSYGVQFGSTLNGGGLDFTKHLVDFGYSVRFLRQPKPDATTVPNPGVHKPLDLELHTTAGLIQNQGAVPVSERFYGGNQPQDFIRGDAWIIPSGATIRSFSENQLGGFGASGSLGGTRFYSANLTLAKVLWGRPLLPKELAEDRDFIPKLHGAVATAKGELADYYKSKDPAFEAANADLDALTEIIKKLASDLDKVSASSTTPEIASTIRSIQSRLPGISRMINAIRKGDKIQTVSLVKRKLPDLQDSLSRLGEQLTAAGQTEAAATFAAERQSIDDSRTSLIANLAKVNTAAAEAKAEVDFAPAQRVLSAFLYELNIYSIAPVAIFDVARVWPANTGTRYGLGGGVRLSLVNVNFTLGYAANPTRNPGESSGALFVKLDVSDLFH